MPARAALLLFLFALLAAGCATAPAPATLESRVSGLLAQRGPGAGSLDQIEPFLRGRFAPPPHTPALARELLVEPLRAADAAAIFARSVPAPVRQFAERPAAGTTATATDIRQLIAPYLLELAGAQRELREATRRAQLDEGAILEQMGKHLPSPDWLGPAADACDLPGLQRATDSFLAATLRLAGTLRASAGRLRFPDKAERFQSEIGEVVIGGPGDDEHAAGAALIVDPGGNDLYRRVPATRGALSVIIDLGGNDRYEGSDLALGGLSAIVDLAGNDAYRMAGPGIGAAVLGASLVLDVAGDDRYEAELFGIGAGAIGTGIVIDLAGSDRYRVRAGGQGLGLTAGLGLLWDHAGDDEYLAGGLPDELDRGGGISMAQGAGFGLRPRFGGGIGILRDDAGDDRYEAEMFAQGVAYWYALGLLWDRGGRDSYRAVRYAQGNGVHLAVGVLREETGDDSYALSVGVGQGMGLDLAVGLLYDGAGDDRYAAPNLAQASATDNGIGILIDTGGRDAFKLGGIGHGVADPAANRGGPSLGIFIVERATATLER